MVAFVTILLVMGGFNVFISVFLMTQGGPQTQTQVLLTWMYLQAFSFLDFGYGSAISFMLTLIVFALSLVAAPPLPSTVGQRLMVVGNKQRARTLIAVRLGLLTIGRW